MKIEYQQSLRDLNTFHIEARAAEMIMISSEQDLIEALQYANDQQKIVRILGGGSNILLTGDTDNVVLLNRLKGFAIVQETEQYADICFSSGETWHQCVTFCVERNLGGIENLSLIPGSIGAAPIQNIGAYGVELKDVFVSLEAMHRKTLHKKTFTHAECHFAYRDSIFKQAALDQYFILSVTLRLSKHPVYNTAYGDIQSILAKEYNNTLNLKNISAAIIRIRQSKLPDPEEIGNAGSFFKNPVINAEQANLLKQHFPDMPVYQVDHGVKVPAAWLIEQCHWKGFREGNYGVHQRQALVLVNYDNALGSDILRLSDRIITSVQQKFNIRLEREVNIW